MLPVPVPVPPPPAVETVRVTHAAPLHARVGGRRVGVIRVRTPYGSRTRLWVRSRTAGWLKVPAMDAPGNAGWIRARATRPAPPLSHRVRIDRSARRLTVLGTSTR